MHTSTKSLFSSSVLLVVVMLLSIVPSFGQTISGTVFRDFNSNGVYNSLPTSPTASYTYGEPGVGGITVTAYNAAGAAIATATSSTILTSLGNYTLTVGNTNAYRVEFTNIGLGNYESFRATAAGNNGTAVQFVNGGTTNVNFGINYPLDYCQASPTLVVPCYINGNPLSATGTAGSEHVLVTVPYTASGTLVAATSLADGVDIGSVWGVAYQRETQKVFSAAFLKRHVGLGPGGLGGIYVTTTTGVASTSLLVDLENAPFNINLGQTPLGARATLPGSGTASSTDPTAFSLVGTAGLGGMALSSDGRILYVVDLFNRNLLALNIGNPAVTAITAASSLTTISIANPGCVNGDYRPFAVSVKNNRVYVGIVCSGLSGTVTASTNSDLYAHVQSMVEGASTLSSTPIFSFRLNYTKGNVREGDATLGSTWQPWITGFNQLGISSVTATGGVRVGRPQPMLTDITFADNGDMILDFADRTGFQTGYRQRNTTDNSNTPTLYGGYIGGDILRATNNGTQWVLENNGTVGALTGGGAGNLQGPGTPTASGYNSPSGEFYYQESYTDPSSSTAVHQETSMGSGFSVPGYNTMVNTIMDPFRIFSGGLGWFSNTSGARTQQAELYYTLDDLQTGGKANGLGGIKALCAPAPLEIGNRVWLDSNNNGIQDPGEPPLAGVVVTLAGNGLASPVSVTTNANGEYYFSNAAGTNSLGFAYNLTGISSGSSYTLTFPTSVTTSNAYISSKPNSATGTNASNIDTDANAAGRIIFTLGSSGQNNFSYDAGYAPCVPPSLTALASSASVCQGGSLVLTAQVSPAASYTYAWSAPAGITLSGANTATATASSLTATGTRTFTVTVSTSPICSTTATVTITVNALPTAALSSATICAGQTATLTATGGTSYTFSTGLTNTTGILSVTPTANTTYSVTAINANGCISTNAATGTVTVNPAVTATLGSATICAGQTANLVASGGTSYTFSTGLTNTTGALSVTPATTTTYSVTVANANGCVSTATGTVTVNPLPTIALSSATICVGRSTTLAATGGTSYTYSNGTINTSGQLVVTPTTTTVYSVTGINANGCTSVASATATVNQLPTAALSSATICVGQTANLLATGGTSYTFSTGSINPAGTLSVSPITTTTYSVTVANGNGCIGTATGTVTVNPLPTAALSSATICVGQTANLVATGGTSYTFSNGTSNTTGALAVNPATTTTYSVTVANASGCISTTTATVTVNPLPNIALTSVTVCIGQSTTLVATGGTSYTYSNGTINTSGQLVVTPTTTTVYSVTGINANGCTSVASATATVNQLPTAALSSATICVGQTANLLATGGTSYTFSTGLTNTTGALPVTPATTTTYSVTVANGNGCIGTATGTVTVNPLPTAALSSATICVGQTANLVATGGTSYTFSNGTSNTTGALAVNPATTTTYSVTVANASGCISTTTATVTVNPLPNIALTSVTVCIGQSTTLVATGGTSYTFSNGTINVSGRLPVTPTTTTVYSVTGINANGCTSVASATATVNQLPTAALSSATICVGQTANLLATGGTSYTFSTGSINPAGTLSVSPITTTTYSVTVANGNGCIGTATGTVTVNPLPTAALSSATICVGQTANLVATSGTSYTFSTGDINTTGLLAVNPTTTTTYSVTVANASGCTSTTTATVTVNALPVATFTSATICAGQTANLVATGGTSYIFSTGGTNNTGLLAVNPTTTTTYSVTVVNASGCRSTTTATVTVNPSVTATLSSATICTGQTANLVANGGTSYTFSNGTSNTSGLLAINPTTTTTYSVTVANGSGCIGTATGTVTVNSLPTAALTPSPATVCAGLSATLTASGGTSYRFNDGTINTTGTLVVVPPVNGINPYSVTVTSGSSCSAVATANITVAPAVTATLSNATICSGTSATLVATGGSSYRFGPGITNTTGQLVVSPVSTTAYSVTVTSAQGCNAIATATVTVNPLPTPTISGNTTLCAGQTISLAANPTTGLTYAWSGPSGSLGSSNPLTIANSTTANSGTYQVLVTNANGCTATASINVTVKPAPVAQILNTSIVCSGNTPGVAVATQVTGGSPPVGYAWYRSGTTGVISTSANPVFSVADTYSLVVTDAAGCISNTATVTIDQPNPIAINAQATNAQCFGEQGSITVTINGGLTPYTVTYAAGATVISTQNTNNVSTLQTGAGSYTITVTDANGCSLTQTAAITQPTPLTVSLTSGGAVCAGQTTGSVNSSVSGGTAPYTYLWSNGATTPNLTNVGGGSYSVVITDANSCTATGSITIPTNPLPDAPTFAATQPTCATTTGTITILTPATGVQYSFDDGISYQAAQTLGGLVPDTYQLRVRDNVTGCVSPATNAIINPVPNAPVASIAGTTIICAGQSISLTASPATGVTYAWTGPGGSLGAANPLVIPNATTAQTGLYQVRVSDANSCSALASINVTVNELPVATLSSATICAGQPATLIASGGTSYTFSNGVINTTGSITVTPTSTTAYSVTVVNTSGCISTTSATVTVNPSVTATLSSATICIGNSATLTASGGTSYTFSTGEVNTSGQLVVTPGVTTPYAVTVANASGCIGTTSATATVNQVPASSLSSATICAGQSTVLTASGGNSYTFSTGLINTTGTLSVTPTVTTTYSVTASGGTNCISSASGTVTVNQLPVANLTPASPSICVGQSVVLTASGGTSYSFSTGDVNTTGSITVAPTSTTAYSVTVANASGCISTTTANVTVNPLPVITITPVPATLCIGQSVTLTATGGTSYSFSNGTTNNSGRLVIAPGTTTTYSVTVGNASGCTSTTSVTVPVNQLPTPTITSATICAGQSATLIAGGGTSYTFSTGISNADGRLDVSPTTTTTYSVTVANASGCISTTTGTVTVNQLPTATLTPAPATICVGQSVVLTASGGTSYTFSTGDVNTTGSITVAPTSTTAYSVTVATGSSCISTTSVTVTVNQPPVVTLTPTPGTICAGQSVTLTASGGTSYTFSNGSTNTTGTIEVSPVSTTAYSVTVASASGCISTTSVTVPVNQLPTPTITSATICAGQEATLTATGGTSYTFSTGEINTTGALSVTPATTTTYSVTVANASGCISTTTGTVTVNQLPTATLTPAPATICVGQSVVLTASGGTSYTFSTGDVNTTGSITVAPTSTTAYSVTVATGSSCISTTSVTVTVNQPPVVTLTPTPGTICAGQSVTLTASGGTSYTFSNGSTNTFGRLVIAPSTTTTYSVTAINASGCISTTSVTVPVNQLPTPTITSATICAGQEATLTAAGGTSYTFSTGEINTTGALSVTPATTTTYSVTVANASGCISTTTGTVTVNQLPTATLTPAPATICVGQSVVLTASGGTSYTFSTGDINTTGSITVAPTSTTAYSVTAATGSSCISTTSVIVTVNPLPTPTITSATICAGQEATLTAAGGTSYTFSTGEVNTTGALSVTPATTTTYSVTVANASGCISTTTGTVTVNELPAAVMSASSATICEGLSTTLTATGGTSYTFSTGEVNTTGILPVTPATTTTYSVTVANASGCISTTSATVTVNPSVTAAIGSATICAGETIVLVATGGTSYTFSTGLVNTTGYIEVSPTTTTVYAVTAINASGCSSATGTMASSGTVTVNQVPTAAIIASSTSICAGQSVTLTASGGISYNFSTGDINTSGIVVVTPTEATTYVVTVGNDSGCESTTSIAIDVNPLPIATMTSAIICEGQSATLTASGGTSYTFSNGTINATGVLVVTPATTTTYSVTVASASGCVSTTSGSVTVNTLPVASLIPVSATICEGQSVNFTASGGTSYTFSNGTTNTTGLLAVTPTTTTTYSVTVANASGCVSTASATVTVNQNPAATLTSVTICEGQSATLTAGGGTSYTFSTGATNTDGLLAVNPAFTTTYSVTAVNASGCISTTSAIVTVNQVPALTLSSETICSGLTTTLRATPGFATYLFSAGLNQVGTSNEATSANAGTYSVTAITAEGCSATATGAIVINNTPVVQLTSATICTGQSATLVATAGFDTYLFSPGLAQIGNSNVVIGTVAGVYSVTATSAGCSGVGSGSITIESLPIATLSSATICVGQPVTLTATGGTLYTFSNGTINTSGLLAVAPTATTPYSVTVENAAGCVSTTTAAVTVNELPVADLSSATICVGQSATLVATGGVSYVFSNGISNATGILIVSPTTTTAYSVTVVNASGCVSSTAGAVTVNALPVATMASITVCEGLPATLVASGGTSYTFSTGETNLTGQLSVAPVTTTTYSVTVANASGCITSTTATVTVNPLPTITTTLACNGISTYDVSFTVTPGATVTANVGTLAGNQITGIPSGQIVTITVTLNGCSVIEELSQNCQSNAAGLGNFVWNDLDRDGVQDAGEPGIPEVVVVLLQGGNVVASTLTDANGFYQFAGLTPGIPYSVSFTTPAGFTATLQHQHYNGDDDLDSDADPVTGLTQSVTLANGEYNLSLDAGFYIPSASLGNFVWNDLNQNGIQDAGEPGIPGVVVTIISNGTAIASTTTDASGLYSFTGLTPGVPYSLSFTTPVNYTATIANAGNGTNDSDPIGGITGPITLTAGENNTSIDAGFYAVTAGLGDFVFEDTNRNGVQDAGEPGIPNVVVSLISNGTLVASTTTDANGLYSFTGLTPNTPYSVSFTAPVGYSATLQNQGDDTTDSDGNPATGLTGVYSLTANEFNPTVDMGYYRPASLGDYVWVDVNRNGIQDAGEPPLAGVVVTLLDGNNTPIASVTTTSTGQYSFTGLTPGVPYSVSFTAPVGYSATLANQGGDDAVDSDPIGGVVSSITLASGETNTSVDAGFYAVTAGLGDFVFEDTNRNGVQDAGEPGIPNVVVSLISNGTLVASTTTDANGLYSFTGLTPNTPYSVSFTAPVGYSATLQNQGDDATDSDGNPAGLTGIYSLTANEFNPTVDMGYYRPASLNGYVWIDTDRNGTQGPTEPALPGVIVTIISNGTVVATTTTDASGLYSFTGLTPGVPYSVSFTTPAGFSATAPDQGGDDTIDSDAIGGLTPSVTLTSGQSTTLDAGFYPTTAGLGDFVFEDTNRNGVQDAGEPGIPNVVVSLISNGTLVASTTTDANGLYSFTGLTPNTPYSVSFTAPVGYSATLQNQGDDATDSDGNPAGLTGIYSLTANEFNPTVDMGYYRPASLNGYVWIDTDRNGTQGPTEPALPGVIVTIISNGTVVATTTTDASGLYSFTGLTPGVPYSVSFTTPAGFSATAPDQGGDDTIDSDAIGGLTPSVTLTSGQSTTLDAGFYTVTAGLGDLVFEDLNHNGQQDAGEPGIPGVTVSLIENGVILVGTTTTDANGLYSFTGLTPNTPYSVSFTAPVGYSATLQNQGDDVTDSDGNPATGLTGVYSLTANEFNPTVDMGYYRPASLGDYVWVDVNRNGIQDAGEPPLAGVVVTLLDGNNTPIASVTTTSTGQYSFTGLTPGVPYSVSFTAPVGYSATLANQGGDDAVDSDPIGGVVSSITLASGETNTSVDAGFLIPTGSIGSFVWNDLDRDGQRDPGEPGVDGVTVRLLQETSPGNYTVVSTTVTTGGGQYLFTNLPAGTYIVEFDLTTLPPGFIISPNPNRPGVPTTENSDANPTTGRSAPITLDPTNPAQPDVLAIDAGLETDCPPAKCVPFVIKKTRGR